MIRTNYEHRLGPFVLDSKEFKFTLEKVMGEDYYSLDIESKGSPYYRRVDASKSDELFACLELFLAGRTTE